jgi:hypothetical protein
VPSTEAAYTRLGSSGSTTIDGEVNDRPGPAVSSSVTLAALVMRGPSSPVAAPLAGPAPGTSANHPAAMTVRPKVVAVLRRRLVMTVLLQLGAPGAGSEQHGHAGEEHGQARGADADDHE